MEVTGITHDSRAVRPGDLYAALPGARLHGADFVTQAAGLGAVAVLTDPTGAERAAATGLPVLVVDDPRGRMGELAATIYGHPGRDLLQIGITGTSGKTTTAYLVEGGLKTVRSTGLIGTVEMRIGDERIKSERTTPEATDLQALFAVMRERGVEAVAMEVSSHALVLGRVDGCVFDIAVFNNLSPEHMEFHSDMEDYFRAKAQLFTPERSKLGVVNLDDEYGRRLAKEATVPVVTFSAEGHPDADWRAEDVEVGPMDSTFVAVGPKGERITARSPLAGPFNVANTLAAIVALAVAGLDPQTAADGIAAVPGVPGRLERVDAGQPYLAVVDYAHKTDAVESVLRALRKVTEGKLHVVLGCGGDRDKTKRMPMGAAVGPARRHRRTDLRQPPLRGPPRDPRHDARGRRRGAGARARRGPGLRGPGRRHRRRRRPRAARRHRAGRGQGPRAGPGHRRGGASLRRPPGASRSYPEDPGMNL